ncbi:MAG: N-6 DNA methylase [Acidobacteriota bacterium]|nr:N-6 DNA methylase [Acidobacteriota bacterium]
MTLSDIKTRPDYAVTCGNGLTGFIEVKAPGKGADPRRFRDPHDREQWTKLQTLPNLIYTDGSGFSLWRSGELAAQVPLAGDVETAGAKLSAPDRLLSLFADFFRWEPQPPRSAKELADTTARLCRLLREEVTEQLGRGSASLTNLAEDWRKLLFPSASDEAFADGYAQAVTFGLLMARARDIRLADGLHQVSRELRDTNTLIGSALGILTDDADSEKALKTSLATLTRVLDAVHWFAVSKGEPEAWLYFYEEFLSVYDNDLRKKTGSYYTPPEVVSAMVRLVDEALRSGQRFALPEGLASENVTVADPAVGTGTFLLGVLRRIARTTEADQGPGAVPGVVEAASSRLIGFEMQFGPFAVAQLRLLAELRSLLDDPEAAPATRLFVTDTLGNPYAEEEYLPNVLVPIGESRQRANAIKREEKITVVIGNPPYKEKAKGLGGWIERGSASSEAAAPLRRWMPPAEWNLGAHTKHLRNLYVYFWRWATWKVFGDADLARIEDYGPDGTVDGDTSRTARTRPADRRGIVCFITVAGFLNGRGFEKMRAELRRDADEIWVIDCSPEGHQPDVRTRIFQGVQQPVCIVMAIRTTDAGSPEPARVRCRALPCGHRTEKFAALGQVTLDDDGWTESPSDPRASFFPRSAGAWREFVALKDLFDYDGSGVMPGRTWVVAPDQGSLEKRWKALQSERDTETRDALFHPHPQGDKHVHKPLRRGLHGHEFRSGSVASDTGAVVRPVRYGHRSFDRQWIIPDGRLINRPNPTLWASYSSGQVHMTALQAHALTAGPAVTFSASVPDLHHYNGRGGRVFPLWADRERQTPNFKASLLREITGALGVAVGAPDLMAYFAAVAAHPAFAARFRSDLVKPGLRFPMTAESSLFAEAVEIGREIIWLHCFGERFAAVDAGRPGGPPRIREGERPFIPKDGAIPTRPDRFPNRIDYYPAARRLKVGDGFIDNVPPAVWAYEVSGQQVLVQWFSYRRGDRSRPIIGSRRPPSALERIQPDGWLAEYTTELMNVLHVLGRLVALEPRQSDLLSRICDAPVLSADNLDANGAFASGTVRRGREEDGQASLLENPPRMSR